VAGLLSLGTRWLRGPLLGVWADVGAAPGDGEDQSFVAEDLNRSQDRVTANVVRLLELLHGRQWTVVPLAFGDPRAEDEGWTVLVYGAAHHMDTEAERAPFIVAGLGPWTEEIPAHFIRVTPTHIWGGRARHA
jgi:hypothetical protein